MTYFYWTDSSFARSKVRTANFKANAVRPRSLDEVYPELVLSPSKGEAEGLGMTLKR